jgi:hypothetical protein
LLGELWAVAVRPEFVCEVERLRHEAEEFPTSVLGCVTARALDLTETLCWDSVTRGDTAAFSRQAEVSAQLYEFGVCSGLLKEGP